MRSARAIEWPARVARLTAALLDGDADTAQREVRDVHAAGATSGTTYVRLITPALHRVGDAWAAGRINVAVEHRAHQICVAIVAQLSESFEASGPPRGTAVTLTPPGEQHALAAAMVADFLRGAGYTVHHLGSGVPLADLAMFLRVVPADVVCFSVTQPLRLEQYQALVEAARTVDPATEVLFGGQGVDDAAACAVGGIPVRDVAGLLSHLAA